MRENLGNLTRTVLLGISEPGSLEGVSCFSLLIKKGQQSFLEKLAKKGNAAGIPETYKHTNASRTR